MKRAKIIGHGIISWSEMCFCSPPLKHERETVYNNYLTDIETEIIDEYVEYSGKPFFEFLEKQFKK